MTGNKRKRERLQKSQLQRAKQLANIDATDERVALPPGAIEADPQQLRHNNTYGALPRFYVDKLLQCRQCGTEEIWTAARQKWWYEVAKGNIYTQAVLCRSCRDAEKERKAKARQVHLEGVARKRERRET